MLLIDYMFPTTTSDRAVITNFLLYLTNTRRVENGDQYEKSIDNHNLLKIRALGPKWSVYILFPHSNELLIGHQLHRYHRFKDDTACKSLCQAAFLRSGCLSYFGSDRSLIWHNVLLPATQTDRCLEAVIRAFAEAAAAPVKRSRKLH